MKGGGLMPLLIRRPTVGRNNMVPKPCATFTTLSSPCCMLLCSLGPSNTQGDCARDPCSWIALSFNPDWRFILLFYFILGWAHGMQKYPGQWSNLCHSSDNTRYLRCCTTGNSLSLFTFMISVFYVLFKKFLLLPKSQRHSSIFFSFLRICIILAFTFGAMSHL